MRAVAVAGALLALGIAAGARAQLEEVFSKYVRVYRPQGTFAERIIRYAPPRGSDWRLVDDQKLGYQLSVPTDAEVDATPKGSRALQVTLGGAEAGTRPTLRIDAFTPGKDDPTYVDLDYADRYAAEYPQSAYNGKFALTDSGMVTLLPRKTNLALVGGTHPLGAVQAYRLQLVDLGKEHQLFFTFDCLENQWPQYQDTVAKILLTYKPREEKRK